MVEKVFILYSHVNNKKRSLNEDKIILRKMRKMNFSPQLYLILSNI